MTQRYKRRGWACGLVSAVVAISLCDMHTAAGSTAEDALAPTEAPLPTEAPAAGPVEAERHYWGLLLGTAAVAGLDYLLVGGYPECVAEAEGLEGLGCPIALMFGVLLSVPLSPVIVNLAGDASGLQGDYLASLFGSVLGLMPAVGAGVLFAAPEDMPYVAGAIAFSLVHASFATLGYLISDDAARPRSKGEAGTNSWLSPTLVPGPDGEVFGGLQFFSVW